ncbi:unnamed protein product [Ambrosiozyma monospora]|uniref:Unnamed protein product n=1 Tax=Ambrosiozyma monospora TaxID=43982 RepID=A0A9W6YTV4_AMBMO|nr:unnamed protein product [Ambrosiozyma monospora]
MGILNNKQPIVQPDLGNSYYAPAMSPANLAPQPATGYPRAQQPANGYPRAQQPANGYPRAQQPDNGYQRVQQPDNGYARAQQPATGYARAQQPYQQQQQQPIPINNRPNQYNPLFVPNGHSNGPSPHGSPYGSPNRPDQLNPLVVPNVHSNGHSPYGSPQPDKNGFLSPTNGHSPYGSPQPNRNGFLSPTNGHSPYGSPQPNRNDFLSPTNGNPSMSPQTYPMTQNLSSNSYLDTPTDGLMRSNSGKGYCRFDEDGYPVRVTSRVPSPNVNIYDRNFLDMFHLQRQKLQDGIPDIELANGYTRREDIQLLSDLVARLKKIRQRDIDPENSFLYRFFNIIGRDRWNTANLNSVLADPFNKRIFSRQSTSALMQVFGGSDGKLNYKEFIKLCLFLKACHSSFSCFDTDNSHSLEMPEFIKALQKSNLNPSNQLMVELYGNGDLTFEKYCVAVIKVRKMEKRAQHKPYY